MARWERVAENIVRNVDTGALYLRAKVGGKVIRRSLGTDNLRIAKKVRDKKLAGLRGRVAKPSAGTVGEGIAVLRSQVERMADRKPATLVYYRSCLDLLEASLGPNKQASWLTSRRAEEWWQEFVGHNCATKANNVLTWAVRLGDVLFPGEANPMAHIRRVSVQGRELSLPSREEFKALLSEIRASRKANSEAAARWIEFAAYSGLRKGEMGRLQWADIGSSTIRVAGGLDGSKNRRVRHVPIIPPMSDLLSRMQRLHGPVFYLKDPRGALSGACSRLGIQHMRIHDLRHLFATSCIEAGVDIPTVSKWLGHLDGGVLAMRIYGHLRDEHSAAQAARVVF